MDSPGRHQEAGTLFTAGEVFDHRTASQYAAVVNDPPDALFRVSVEPGGPGTDQREIVLWLSAWGDQANRVNELRTRWTSVLERLFPEQQ